MAIALVHRDLAAFPMSAMTAAIGSPIRLSAAHQTDWFIVRRAERSSISIVRMALNAIRILTLAITIVPVETQVSLTRMVWTAAIAIVIMMSVTMSARKPVSIL